MESASSSDQERKYTDMSNMSTTSTSGGGGGGPTPGTPRGNARHPASSNQAPGLAELGGGSSKGDPYHMTVPLSAPISQHTNSNQVTPKLYPASHPPLSPRVIAVHSQPGAGAFHQLSVGLEGTHMQNGKVVTCGPAGCGLTDPISDGVHAVQPIDAKIYHADKVKDLEMSIEAGAKMVEDMARREEVKQRMFDLQMQNAQLKLEHDEMKCSLQDMIFERDHFEKLYIEAIMENQFLRAHASEVQRDRQQHWIETEAEKGINAMEKSFLYMQLEKASSSNPHDDKFSYPPYTSDMNRYLFKKQTQTVEESMHYHNVWIGDPNEEADLRKQPKPNNNDNNTTM